MNTVERVKSICKERNIPISKLEKDLGFGNAYISGLKKGSIPDDRLRLIADYLGLSTYFLMTGEEPQLDYLYNDGNVEFLIEVTKGIRYEEFVNVITKYMSLAEDDKKSVNDMIDFLYEKENKRDDG